MSETRFSDPAASPAGTVAPDPCSAALARLVDRLVCEAPPRRDRLLELLGGIEAEVGWVSPEAQVLIADRLGLAAMDVATVASCAGRVATRPPARVRLEVCSGAGCALDGGDRLVETLRALLGLAPEGITPDGGVSLDVVSCLGACERSPAIRVNGHVVGPLTPGGLHRLLADLTAGVAVDAEGDRT